MSKEKKLSKDELFQWLDLVFGKGFDTYILSEDYAEDNERSEQAYEQIKSLIEDSIESSAQEPSEAEMEEFVEFWEKRSGWYGYRIRQMLSEYDKLRSGMVSRTSNVMDKGEYNE